MTTAKSKLHITAVLATLWLAACGGGGGGGDIATAPPPAPAPAPAPGPAPAPAPAVPVTGDMQLAANTNYSIAAPGVANLTVTLPASAGLNANDAVSITGSSATHWTVAQNAGQSVLTTGLSGNVAPGAVWTPRLAPKMWHWISSDATGQVLLAGEAGGGHLNTSTDGGQTWITGNSPAGIWISSDMSATGNRMVAVQYGGGMYMSTDFGVTWTQVTSSALVNVTGGLSFESVTMSQDGLHIVAAVQPTTGTTPTGRLAYSNDGGATWALASLPVGTYWWRSVDNSADGQVIVAAEHNGSIFLSTNAGATWSPLTVALTSGSTTTPVASNSWYRVKLSADGNTIAIVANSFGTGPGTGIFVSHNRGATWTQGFSLTADYTSLAMSSDGATIAATVSNPNSGSTATATGRVLLSTNSGTSFAPVTMPGTNTDWRTIAMSSDGNKMAAAAGNFASSSTGQLYTSQGNRTSIGTAGSIAGGQNDSVTLTYLGSGKWSVQASAGGPFTIR
jgi:hypothetical protein